MRKEYTKREIWDTLTRPDDPLVDRQDQRRMHAIGRALVAIASRRHLRHTELITREPCGFSGHEAERGESMALYYTEHGALTDRQIKWWLCPDTRGTPRICKYWWQLCFIANEKLRAIESRRQRYLPNQLDLFDSDETVMDRAESIEKYRQERQERWLRTFRNRNRIL